MTTQPELPWVHNARLWTGTAEIAGAKHNPKIVGIWPAIGITWFKDDETPYCAGAMSLWLQQAIAQAEAGGPSWPKPMPIPSVSKRAAALSYIDYGKRLMKPAYGAIAVKRRKGGGHVTLIVGRYYRDGKLACLGANQDDQVTISAYDEKTFETFRWPTGNDPLPIRYSLPILDGTGAVVGSEA